jgi:hypothetical protein
MLAETEWTAPVAAGVSKEAPHVAESTGVDAHPPIAF